MQERQDLAIEEMRRQQEEFRQRQAETDRRFNVLLEEVRYLIRRQGSGSEFSMPFVLNPTGIQTTAASSTRDPFPDRP